MNNLLNELQNFDAITLGAISLLGVIMIFILQFIAMASVSGELGGAGIFTLLGRIIAFSYYSIL